MRLIGKFDNESQARAFSQFLTREGVENLCEWDANKDWDSPEYGQFSGVVWVYEEDKADAAKEWLDSFKLNPQDPRFTKEPPSEANPPKSPYIAPNAYPARKQGLVTDGILTIYILFLCCFIFIWTVATEKNQLEVLPAFIPPTAIVSSPAKKILLYDYPQAYKIAEKLLLQYDVDKLSNPEGLTPQGQILLNQFRKTPYWQGIYEEFIKVGGDPLKFHWAYQGQMFERIRDGEWWRLFSPILLHGDIFHILFNMIWLVVLGQQIEKRVGKIRYVLFILVAAAFSNTAQYLMSGPNFLGFSGVICAMLAFIWARQRTAPWEGYFLQNSTILFIALFVFAMFALQLTSFFFEIWYHTSLTPGIANTAHLAGAFIGYFMGRLRLFAL
jgi:GlpG protein